MKKPWDVIVVGGGPAGMMCAGKAGARGLNVLLLEQNPILGKKLRITGGGRCNITNATFDHRKLLANYVEAAPFLFSTFAKHDVKDTLDFFSKLGLDTKTEAENRVFPVSERAEDVALILEKYLKENKVTCQTDVRVLSFIKKDNLITEIKTSAGDFSAKTFVIATGGTSRPETGATGDGYKWLRQLGHEVITPTPSLVPITLKEVWVEKMAGRTLPETTFSIWGDNQLIKKCRGKILFTHNGLSGPGILNASQIIGEALTQGEVVLKMNLTPTFTEEKLNQHLSALLVSETNRKIKNVIATLIPTTLTPILLNLANIEEDRKCNSITRSERHTLISLLRALPVTVNHLLGPEKAIIASGGVALTEIDFKNMRSKIYSNLYIIGDMLNIVRPSGGYSLQLCWTTGAVAGDNV